MDIAHTWGQGLAFAANGDLLTVAGPDETRQRLLRGLMTSLGEYVFHLDYGVGVGGRVGDALSGTEYLGIQAAIRGLVINDPDVLAQPAPSFQFNTASTGMLGVRISYTDRARQTQTLAFSVSK